MTAALAPFVARVIAVDNSAAMLAAAKRRLAGSDTVDFRRGDLEGLPIGDAELDAAVLTLVLPYLPEPSRALFEVARVLKPGGRVLITDVLPHDREGYRQQLGHQWLGFSETPDDELAHRRRLHRHSPPRAAVGAGSEGTRIVRRTSQTHVGLEMVVNHKGTKGQRRTEPFLGSVRSNEPSFVRPRGFVSRWLAYAEAEDNNNERNCRKTSAPLCGGESRRP